MLVCLPRSSHTDFEGLERKWTKAVAWERLKTVSSVRMVIELRDTVTRVRVSLWTTPRREMYVVRGRIRQGLGLLLQTRSEEPCGLRGTVRQAFLLIVPKVRVSRDMSSDFSVKVDIMVE